MKELTEYFGLQQKIFDYFGYKQDWVTIPLSDATDCFWHLSGEKHGDTCYYMEEPFTKENIKAGDVLFSGQIYTQRFLPKWVYRGPEYTMVAVDTQVDNNKYLMVFDNSKELKDKELQEQLEESW